MLTGRLMSTIIRTRNKLICLMPKIRVSIVFKILQVANPKQIQMYIAKI